MQIQATLVKGKGRIVFSHVKVRKPLLNLEVASLMSSMCVCVCVQGESYTLAKAQHAYKSLVKIHEKSGEEEEHHVLDCTFPKFWS